MQTLIYILNLRPSCTIALSLLAFRLNAQLHQCTKCKENTYKNTKYTFTDNSEKYSINLAFNLVPSIHLPQFELTALRIQECIK